MLDCEQDSRGNEGSDMKKIIGFVLTLFTVATLFAAARPSLDGRALVADSGSMPKGLFARTIGYLPGDSVAVTNPSTGSTVDVLILGAIDPSEGVAILLSPEAADKLNITKDSNVQVKITKRAGSLDEVASGAAIVSESDEPYSRDYDENPIEELDGARKAGKNGVTMKSLLDEPEDELTEDPDSMPVPPPAVVVELPKEESLEEPSEEEADAPVVEEPVVVVEAVSEETEDSPVVEPLDETYAMEDAADESEGELYNPFAVEENAEGEERVVFIDAPGNPAEDAAVVAEEPAADEDARLDDLAEMIKPGIDEEPIVAEDVVVEYVDDVPPDVVEPAPSEMVVLEDVPEEAVAEEVAEADSEEDGAYQPIVLVPAGENPPVAEEKADEPVAVVAKTVAPVSEPVAEPEPAPVAKTPETADFIVPTLKDLKKDSYYVQIASLGGTENVDGLLAKYCEKYPMVVVPLSSGKSYQVMVGPLTTDEYTVVQEKFRAFGFKDAFLRKIR